MCLTKLELKKEMRVLKGIKHRQKSPRGRSDVLDWRILFWYMTALALCRRSMDLSAVSRATLHSPTYSGCHNDLAILARGQNIQSFLKIDFQVGPPK